MTKQTLTKAAANQTAKVSSAFVFERRIVKAGDKITLKHSDFKMLQHRGKVIAMSTSAPKKSDVPKKPAAAKAENESKTPNENDDG